MLADSQPRPRHLEEVYGADNPETGTPAFHNISMPITPIAKGDTFYVLSSGGAGYSDALERDPQLVPQDLRDGVVTQWTARNVSFVVTDEHVLRVDQGGTDALRAEERWKRKARGKTWDEFHREWNGKRPPTEVIKCYGAYPHPCDGVNAHPAVQESAAVAVGSELGEDEVLICVVLKPGRAVPAEELIAHCEARMARFMVPRYVRFMASLPKTPTERVQK